MLLLSRIRMAASDAFGIPGTTQTVSGYDTEMGEDPMCWSSVASATPEGGIAFPNGALVKDFALADKVELLSSCPDGTRLEALSPPEFSVPGFRPRTLHWYNYTVTGSVDLSGLSGTHIAADEGSKIAIAILACDSLLAGFCSPFVHEQANIRLAREKEAKMAAGIHIPPAGPKVAGNRHGSTHVHSPAVVLDIPRLPDPALGYDLPPIHFDFEVQVPVIVNQPGNFFIVGTLQFFTGDSPFTPVQRYDVANALKASERLVIYQEPATILDVTKPILIVSYVSIGLASAILLGLIAQILKHRNHQVLRISQVSFLFVFLLAGLVATVSCFLLKPNSDLWCNLSHPLIVTSLHMFYSITLARLWRINAVVSPLLKHRLQRANSKRAPKGLKGFFERSLRCCGSGDGGNIRREVSPAVSFCIVFASCFPQVLLQVSAWLLQPQSKGLEYNESQSIGRCVCSDGLSAKESIRNYSLYLLLLLVLVLLGMGHVARNLPSLLNESQEIYDTTVLSVLLALLGGGVLAVTNAPTTSPDVAYLIKTVVVLSITINSALRIIVPKLKMVWTDQKIVISKLVSDQRQSLMSSYNTNYFESSTSHVHVSGVMNNVSTNNGMPNNTSSGMSQPESKNSVIDSTSHLENSSATEESPTPPPPPEMAPSSSSPSGGVVSKASQELWLRQVENDCESPPPPQDGEVVPLHDDHDQQVLLKDEVVVVPLKANTTRRVNFTVAAKNNNTKAHHNNKASSSSSKKRIVIRQGEAPSKKVVLRMVDLQQELEHVTKQVMCGLNVEPQDWQAVRKLTEQLSDVFATTQFDFEQKGDDHEDDEELGGGIPTKHNKHNMQE
jgi:hypothetical protein